MSGLPPADIDITLDTVTQLLATSPWPNPTTVRYIASGFDNDIWWADGRTVRLPRRQVAVAMIEHEHRWLNQVVAPLELETPAIVHVGQPTAAFSFPWSISHYVNGVSGLAVSSNVRGSFASTLGRALAALHVESPDGAPRNPWRGVSLNDRRPHVEERLSSVAPRDAATIRRHFDAGCKAAEWSAPLRWVHGDVHPGNLIYRDDELVGLIDFSDLGAGDPAVDLGGALLSLPPESHEALWHSYGKQSDDFVARAYGWTAALALFHSQIDNEAHQLLAKSALNWLSETN